jgi:methylmalonyl-CoA mutase N-terminal domain/subunit
VGVNAYQIEEPEPSLMRIDPAVERRQVERLQCLRRRRDASKVQTTLARLEAAARGTDNLVPLIIEAVEAYATLGEIADTFRQVFGEHQENIVLAS